MWIEYADCQIWITCPLRESGNGVSPPEPDIPRVGKEWFIKEERVMYGEQKKNSYPLYWI